MKKIFFIILIFPLLLMGQSQSENYIKTRTYTAKSTGPITVKDTLVLVNYLDGLGRTKQTISVNAGGSGQNIVTPVVYDAYGRQTKEYLPYANPSETVTSGTLNYIDNSTLLTTQQSYYGSKFPSDLSGPFPNTSSSVIIENSPLQRITQRTSPGNQWNTGGHTVKFDYGTNSSAIAPVFDFKIRFTNNETDKPELYLSSSSRGGSGTFYASGALYKTITKDENWVSSDGDNKTLHEYKDKQGRLILSRKFNEDIAHDTYYVYDMFGNLTYVIPPQAFAEPNFITTVFVDFLTTYVIDQTILEKYSYIYKYDSRNRIIEKLVPGKGTDYIVYDKLDRPVLTQNANQRDVNGNGLKWLFTKYDKFDRIIYTGEYSSTATRLALQNALNAANTLSESKVSSASQAFTLNGLQVYYTKTTFPTTSLELFTVSYYDDYTFPKPSSITIPVSTDYDVLTTSLKTIATGSVVRVLDSSVQSWITTVMGYDAKGRLIWSKSDNPYFISADTYQAKLNFAGAIVETKLGQVRTGYGSQTVNVNDFYTYGYAGRPAVHTQKIDNASIAETISSKTYNERGQLIQNTIGGAQTINYEYNIRGWLTKINNPGSLGSDVFAEAIAYNQPTSGTALYNGNISQVSWKTANDNQLRNYNYTYDDLNRIKSAVFTNSSNAAQNNSYNLNSVNYDKNGNITFMQRNGNAMTDMDKMTYFYDGNMLQRIREEGNTTVGFKGVSPSNTAVQYSYDKRGNLKSDLNKGITLIEYNYLDLPSKVTFTGGKYIQYIYDAVGTKLKKIFFDGTSVATTEYVNGLVYLRPGSGASTLQYIPTEEGYVYKNTNGSYGYAYQLKDHLGNIRVSFSDINKSRSVTLSEIIEESNYEPFGLKHQGYNSISSSIGNSLAQKTEYNGKEYEEAAGYNMNEMDWRHYDPAIGRWVAPDPIVHFSTSPYSAFENNPIYWNDPSGTDVFYNTQKTEFTGQDAQNFFSAYVSMLETGEGSFTYDNDNVFQVLPDLEIDGFRLPGGGIGLGQLSYTITNHVYRYSDVHQYLWDEWFSKSAHESLEIIGLVPVIGEIFDGIDAGLYALEGNYGMATISVTAMLPIAGYSANAFKQIQRHHIIPKAVYKNLGEELSTVMKLNAGNNLKKIPSGFHGNHPQYNNFVQNQINNLSRSGNLTPGSIQTLQGNLNSMINQAYDSYKVGGGNLNEYFRALN